MRKIIHIDMDAFYASIEQRDNPSLKGKCLIIGSLTKRSVVSTCSYEARKYGVHSAMPVAQAKKLCPHGIFIPPNMQKYKKVSMQIRKIFYKYSDIVEPLAFDEAYIDVTQNKLKLTSATKIALLIQKEILTTLKLTCSCGISYNKFLAKTASDINKPHGYFIITPSNSLNFLEKMSIRNFYGIGKKSAQKFIQLGIYTGKDLKELSKEQLSEIFKTRGDFYYNIVRGIDNRKVEASREIKSISSERTLYNNLKEKQEIKNKLIEIFEMAYTRLIKQKFYTKTVTIKLKYRDFTQVTRSYSFTKYYQDKSILIEKMLEQLDLMIIKDEVRLIGIGFSNFKDSNIVLLEEQNKLKYEQLTLNI